MGAILPLHAPIIHQAQVGLIHQSRRLQAVAGALAFHIAACQTVELVKNDGGQLLERSLVSVAPGTEKHAYVTHSRFPRLSRPLHRLWAELYRSPVGLHLQPINRVAFPVGQTLGQTASFRQTAPETWCQSRVCGVSHHVIGFRSVLRLLDWRRKFR